MKIEILGTGCAKCETLERKARAVAEKLGLSCEITHNKDIATFASYGVMMTPALVVDGKVVLAGKVPGEGELAELLTSPAS